MQVNMLQAKTDLSRLIHILELNQEESIYIARNGQPVVEMRLIRKEPPQKRIGIAEGLFTVPAEFDSWDEEISDMFSGEL